MFKNQTFTSRKDLQKAVREYRKSGFKRTSGPFLERGQCWSWYADPKTGKSFRSEYRLGNPEFPEEGGWAIYFAN